MITAPPILFVRTRKVRLPIRAPTTISLVIDLARGLPPLPILLFFGLFLVPISGTGRWPWLVTPIAVSWLIGLAGGSRGSMLVNGNAKTSTEVIGSPKTGDPRVEVSVRILGGQTRTSSRCSSVIPRQTSRSGLST
jgi:hypothetical protein